MNALREYFALMHVDYEEMKREFERSRRQQFAGVIDTAQEKIDYSMRESDLIEENSSLRCRVDIAESQREHLKRKIEELEERSHDLESLLVEQVEKSRELVVRLEIAEQVRVRYVAGSRAKLIFSRFPLLFFWLLSFLPRLLWIVLILKNIHTARIFSVSPLLFLLVCVVHLSCYSLGVGVGVTRL